jgi:predicted acylesterase/phospholipase RssA
MIGRLRRMWRRPARPRRALVLGGGGVIGGMYEVGVLTALEERLTADSAWDWDVYVGCSAGAVVAAVLANGVRPTELYRILDEDLADPLNFQRSAVYARDAFRHALVQLARFAWAVGKNARVGARGSIPDMLARSERGFPAGFFSLVQLERYLRSAFASRGLANSFADVGRVLLIPAVDLDRAERVVFGQGELMDVPISDAVAASSAIPGFFEPFAINGRDFVDGGVGWSGHADLAAAAGAELIVVVNPLVPAVQDSRELRLRGRGMYFIMEQTNRIYGRNLLRQNLAGLAASHPGAVVVLLEPPPTGTPLFGPTMGFAASRAALRYGRESTRDWLAASGADLVRRLVLSPVRPMAPSRASVP